MIVWLALAQGFNPIFRPALHEMASRIRRVIKQNLMTVLIPGRRMQSKFIAGPRACGLIRVVHERLDLWMGVAFRESALCPKTVLLVRLTDPWLVERSRPLSVLLEDCSSKFRRTLMPLKGCRICFRSHKRVLTVYFFLGLSIGLIDLSGAGVTEQLRL